MLSGAGAAIFIVPCSSKPELNPVSTFGDDDANNGGGGLGVGVGVGPLLVDSLRIRFAPIA